MFWKRKIFEWLSVLLLVFILSACRDSPDERYAHPGERFNLNDAPYHVFMPAAETVRDDFLTLVVNMEGMEGLLALIEGATGIDITGENLFLETGLDPSIPVVAFGYERSIVIALGVTSRAAFFDFIQQLATAEGVVAREVSSKEEGALLQYGSRVAIGVTGNLGVVLVALDESAPLATLARLLLAEVGPEPVIPPENGYEFRSARESAATIAQVISPYYADIGILAGLTRFLVRHFDSCKNLAGSLQAGDRITATVTAEGCGLGSTVTPQWNPETMVPEDTVLLFQTRFSSQSLWEALPPVLRYLVRTGWAGVKTKKPEGLEDIAGFLQRFEPELAVAFLGMSTSATMDTFSKAAEADAPLFALHVQVIVGLKDGEHAQELLNSETMQELVKGFKPRGIGTGDVMGTEYCRETEKTGKRCFAIIRKHRKIMLVSGLGEGDRLVRVLRGQQLDLSKGLFAHQVHGGITLTLKTRRLVRDLMTKGFPPYFLQMLSSVLEIRVSATGESGSTSATLEVVLR
jgi:hypothetical protein